jgi:hypothetical protein
VPFVVRTSAPAYSSVAIQFGGLQVLPWRAVTLELIVLNGSVSVPDFSCDQADAGRTDQSAPLALSPDSSPWTMSCESSELSMYSTYDFADPDRLPAYANADVGLGFMTGSAGASLVLRLNNTLGRPFLTNDAVMHTPGPSA